MEVLHPRCAGLDVHKDTVVAAVRLTEGNGSVRREVETFGTTTPGLLALSDWLEGHACPTVAMEATGIYWRPVWQVLAAEGSGEGRSLILANAAHVLQRLLDAPDVARLLAHRLLDISAMKELLGKHW